MDAAKKPTPITRKTKSSILLCPYRRIKLARVAETESGTTVSDEDTKRHKNSRRIGPLENKETIKADQSARTHGIALKVFGRPCGMAGRDTSLTLASARKGLLWGRALQFD
jgi:hypothetical protein